MTLKKIMLVAGMAMAAAAMSAPAAQAHAPQWYHEGNVLGNQGNGKALHVQGELASTVIGGGMITGPCEVTFEGEAWNENGMADGVITGGEIQEECETSVEGCTVRPTLLNFPWDLTGITVTEQTGLEITTVEFENHYIGGCPVPVTTFVATGTVTGIVDGSDPRCIDFENHTDAVQIHVSGLPTLTIDILGTVCDTTLTLNVIA